MSQTFSITIHPFNLEDQSTWPQLQPSAAKRCSNADVSWLCKDPRGQQGFYKGKLLQWPSGLVEWTTPNTAEYLHPIGWINIAEDYERACQEGTFE